MRESFRLPTPIWIAQYHLSGGRSRLIGIPLIYAASVCLGLFGFRRVFLDTTLTAYAEGAIHFIGVFQCAIAILWGCNAVYRAMVRDYETKMMESHRLTPLGDMTVVLGYVFGPTIQAMCLLLVNFFIGAILTTLGGSPIVSLTGWLQGNLLIASAAVMMWTMAVFLGMRLGKPISPAGIIIVAGMLSALFLIVLPGAGLILGNYAVFLGYSLLTMSNTVPGAAMGIVVAANLILTIFWLTIAATKYRRPDMPAFNARLGGVFLVIWLVVSAIGILAFQGITQRSMVSFSDPELLATQWVAALIASLIVASVAINGTAVCNFLTKNGTASRGWPDRIPCWAVTLVAVALICGMMATVGFGAWRELFLVFDPVREMEVLDARAAKIAWAYTVVTILLALIVSRGVLVSTIAIARKPNIVGYVFLIFIFAAPPIADAAFAIALADHFEEPMFSWLMGGSSPGTLIAVWLDLPINLKPGLAIQAGLALFSSLLAWRLSRKKQPADMRVPASAASDE